LDRNLTQSNAFHVVSCDVYIYCHNECELLWSQHQCKKETTTNVVNYIFVQNTYTDVLLKPKNKVECDSFFITRHKLGVSVFIELRVDCFAKSCHLGLCCIFFAEKRRVPCLVNGLL